MRQIAGRAEEHDDARVRRRAFAATPREAGWFRECEFDSGIGIALDIVRPVPPAVTCSRSGGRRVLDRGEPARRQLHQPVPQEQCD